MNLAKILKPAKAGLLVLVGLAAWSGWFWTGKPIGWPVKPAKHELGQAGRAIKLN